jgi:flagellin-specific chaperone FliS
VQPLIDKAAKVYEQAQQALADGDFEKYGRLIEKLGRILEQLRNASNG